MEEDPGDSAVWTGKAACKGRRNKRIRRAMMKITAAQGLARILKAEGIPWVSNYPTCNVNNTLAEEGIPLIMMRDERYAVAVADAFSRVTNGKQVGVCTVMGSVNPAGLQMAYGALAQAYEDGSPVLCITDGLPAGAGSLPLYDISFGFRSVTKWIGHIDQPQRVPEFLRRAFTYLRSGRRAPVLITIPRNLGSYDDEQFPYLPVKSWRSAPDPDDVKAAVKALLAAKRPLLLAGEGVFYADAAAELRTLAELAQLPVLTTLKGKSCFPENHLLSVGVRGEMAGHFLRGCDLVLAVGTSLTPTLFHHAIPDARAKTIILATVDEMDINRGYPVAHALRGDGKLTLRALIDEFSTQTGGGVKKKQDLLDEIAAEKSRFMAKYQPVLTSNERPINPYRVYGDLMKALDPHNSFVTPDSGTTRDQLSTIYQSVIPHGFMGWGNVSTLGFGLAAAMAAKLAYPSRQCVNVTGDAGVSYMLGNLEALVRHKVGVTTVHINNGGFAGYGPGFWGPGHDPYTCVVSDHSVADMSEAVKAMGYYTEHVDDPQETIPALQRCLDQNACNRPAYLEVICSRYPVYGEWGSAGTPLR
jgi:thiamine pyrophosphate-dependent acetolactate synthase large subunit-like protein